MAGMYIPPKNNIYSLMLIITTIILVIGLVINKTKLGRYNSYKAIDPPKVDATAIKAMWSAFDNAGEADINSDPLGGDDE